MTGDLLCKTGVIQLAAEIVITGIIFRFLDSDSLRRF